MTRGKPHTRNINKMKQCDFICKQCGKRLYLTLLMKRYWCKECREYKDKIGQRTKFIDLRLR